MVEIVYTTISHSLLEAVFRAECLEAAICIESAVVLTAVHADPGLSDEESPDEAQDEAQLQHVILLYSGSCRPGRGPISWIN